jgi:hypothetical protein
MSPRYFKILSPDMKHNGFQFKEGLNELPENEPFNPDLNCGPGGFYFAKEEHIMEWYRLYVNYYQYHDMEEFKGRPDYDSTPIIPLIAEVTLCEDSQLVEMETKLKTDKFILGKPYPITDYLIRCRFSPETSTTPYFKRTTHKAEIDTKERIEDLQSEVITLQSEVRNLTFHAYTSSILAGIGGGLLLGGIGILLISKRYK